MTTRRKKRHNPEQIVKKLQNAEAMLNAGQDLAAVLQSLEVSEATYHRWRKRRDEVRGGPSPEGIGGGEPASEASGGRFVAG